MENEIEKSNKHMKTSMEINIPSQTEMSSLISPPPAGGTGLARQGSITKNSNCLCSPTNHAGSFRCRLHRATSPTASPWPDSNGPRASTPRRHPSRTLTPTRLMTQVLMKLVLILRAPGRLPSSCICIFKCLLCVMWLCCNYSHISSFRRRCLFYFIGIHSSILQLLLPCYFYNE